MRQILFLSLSDSSSGTAPEFRACFDLSSCWTSASSTYSTSSYVAATSIPSQFHRPTHFLSEAENLSTPSPSSSPSSPAKVYLIKSRPEYWRTDGFLYDGRKLGQTSLLYSQLSHQQPTSFKTIVDAASLPPPL